MEQENTTDLYVLPDVCIADILSRTSPRDACRSSVVSPIFRSVADSDWVWERFLPSDIQLILSSSVSSSLPKFLSKKEQFLHLSDNPLLIDNGTKAFALEKCSGKKCYMIGAKELSFKLDEYSAIYEGETTIYNWKSLPESRFSEVIEFLRNRRVNIRGKMETRLLSPNTTYVAYMVFKFWRHAYYVYDYMVFNFSVKLAIGGHSEQAKVKNVYLVNLKEKVAEGEVSEETEVLHIGPQEVLKVGTETHSPISFLRIFHRKRIVEEDWEWRVPKERGDGWLETEMGEFFNERGDAGEVEMSFRWEGGLFIEGIELRPKN